MSNSLRFTEQFRTLIDEFVPDSAVSANLFRLKRTGARNIYPECREEDEKIPTICHHERHFGKEVDNWLLSCAALILIKMIAEGAVPEESSLDKSFPFKNADLDQLITAVLLQGWQNKKNIQLPRLATLEALLCQEFMIFPEWLLNSPKLIPLPPESKYSYSLLVLENNGANLAKILIIDSTRSHLPSNGEDKIEIPGFGKHLNRWHLETLYYLLEANIQPTDGCVTVTFPASYPSKTQSSPISRKMRKSMKDACFNIGLVGAQERFSLTTGTQRAMETHCLVSEWLRAEVGEKFRFAPKSRNLLGAIQPGNRCHTETTIIKPYKDARTQLINILLANGYKPMGGWIGI